MLVHRNKYEFHMNCATTAWNNLLTRESPTTFQVQRFVFGVLQTRQAKYQHQKVAHFVSPFIFSSYIILKGLERNNRAPQSHEYLTVPCDYLVCQYAQTTMARSKAEPFSSESTSQNSKFSSDSRKTTPFNKYSINNCFFKDIGGKVL